MAESMPNRLSDVHPQMLRVPSPDDPQKLGNRHKREVGQAFEWALDRAHITKQDAAFRMGYADAGVIGRLISGAENLQLWRLRQIGDEFFREFVVALAQLCEGVDVKTQITLNKVG